MKTPNTIIVVNIALFHTRVFEALFKAFQDKYDITESVAASAIGRGYMQIHQQAQEARDIGPHGLLLAADYVERNHRVLKSYSGKRIIQQLGDCHLTMDEVREALLTTGVEAYPLTIARQLSPVTGPSAARMIKKNMSRWDCDMTTALFWIREFIYKMPEYSGLTEIVLEAHRERRCEELEHQMRRSQATLGDPDEFAEVLKQATAYMTKRDFGMMSEDEVIRHMASFALEVKRNAQ